MNRNWIAGAVCALLTFSGVLYAQDATAASSTVTAPQATTTQAPAPSPTPGSTAGEAKPDDTDSTPAAAAPASTDTPQKPFFKRLFTVQAVTSTLPGAILQQVHDWPSEWGKDRLGFEKRVASLYGQFVIGVMIEDGVRAVHHEDDRYRRRGTGGFFPRFAHVVSGTVTARRPDDGSRTISLALPANAYGSWAIATLWSPKEYRNAASIFEWGTAGMGTIAIGNLFREFGPDLLAVVHKKKKQ